MVGGEKHQCHRCQQVFVRKYTLLRHQNADLDCSFYNKESKQWECEHCRAKFVRPHNYKRHLKLVHGQYSRERREPPPSSLPDSLLPPPPPPPAFRLCFACGVCARHFATRGEVKTHRQTAHNLEKSNKFQLYNQAHDGQTTVHRAYFEEGTGLQSGLMQAADQTVGLIRQLASTFPYGINYKMSLSATVEMSKVDEGGQDLATEAFSFKSELFQLRPFTDVVGEVAMAVGDIERSVEEFVFRGSGWVVDAPLFVDVRASACSPLSGSGCDLHVAYHAKKVGLVVDLNSVKLTGPKQMGYCLYYALAAHFVGDRDAEMLDEFVSVWGCPAGRDVALTDLGKVEDAWKDLDIGINVVFKDEDGRILPVRCSPNYKAKNEVVLLLAHTMNPDARHYALVKDPSLLFAKRTTSTSAAAGKRWTSRRYVCWNCCNVVSGEAELERHKAFCQRQNCQLVVMPEKGEYISFQEGDELTQSVNRRTFKSGLMLFFDFECLQVERRRTCACSEEKMERTRRLRQEEEEWANVGEEERQAVAADRCMEWGEEERRDLEDAWYTEWMRVLCGRGERKSVEYATVKHARESLRLLREDERRQLRKQRREKIDVCTHQSHRKFDHKAFAYSLVLVDRELRVHHESTYVGGDATKHFVDTLVALERRFLPQLTTPGVPISNMTKEDRVKLKKRQKCYLCHAHMQPSERVLDHDHLTGKFLGVAHNACNLKRKEDFSIACFAHNLSGYDSHLLVRDLNRHPAVTDIRPIALNFEKFKCFTVNSRLKFLDSAAFLPDSLAKLVENLKATGECRFDLLSRMAHTPRQRELLLRKGAYPYEFATSIARLQNATSLPAKGEFANVLANETSLPAEDYRHAQSVWRAFGCRNMLDYTAVYARSDVLQLAEAVVSLRENVWNEFGLDLCKYLSLPMLSKDIMLKVTGSKMELISDQEMAFLLKDNVRGGLSFINTRLVDRQETEPPTTLTYIDQNNLYGYAMSCPLPLRDFEWMSQEELDSYDPVRDATTSNGPGYILEVDLEYPEELHLDHSSFPLAPHSLDVAPADLSPYAWEMLCRLRKDSTLRAENYKATKLTSTFARRERYLVHAINLKLYLRLGLKLAKLHRGIKFYQEDFIRSFIQLCTQKRKNAPTESLKNMYKLLANSLYGKLIEGTSKRVDCFMCLGRPDLAMRYASSPRFKHAAICGNNCIISFLQKAIAPMRQNWAVGFSILEISKYLMQSLLYETIKPSLASSGGCSVVMSDTDSFLLASRVRDSDEFLERIRHVVDFSNYDASHRLFDPSKAKELGFVKNEVPRAEITRFVGLRSKSYAFQTDRDDLYVKAKGVRGPFKRSITFEAMAACLLPGGAPQHKVDYVQIRSEAHVPGLVFGRKTAFSAFDDKRYLLCAKHSVPYGSRLIALSEEGGECYFCVNPSRPGRRGRSCAHSPASLSSTRPSRTTSST
jgi:hypothetical protein